MPRSREPSAAARRLVQELAARGVTVGYRQIEDWATRGLAPAPVRRSRGRGRGMASEYPPNTVDQYAAVASVMRRGRPWQISVLKLLARGFLPTDETLLRRAFQFLLEPPGADPSKDALGYAEQFATVAAASRFARPVMQVYERNLRRAADILEPGTRIRPVAIGVLATLTLARIGEPEWSQEALTEMFAAHGVPVRDMSEQERAGLAQFADEFFTQVIALPVLAQTAAEAPARRIRAAIPQARTMTGEAFAAIKDIPEPNEDIKDGLIAVAALMAIRIEELGGDDAIAELAKRTLGQEGHDV